MHEMQTVFEEVDVIIGNNFAGRLLQITNFTGHPQLSLRIGFEEREIRPAFEEISVAEGEQGTFPVSIGLWGPLFGEGQMLALGRALEESLNVNSKRPDLDA
jgi:Asp-tRNA(Asn)/Glu-tRNA(Gln) amidotransferase A subunit family amidase